MILFKKIHIETLLKSYILHPNYIFNRPVQKIFF